MDSVDSLVFAAEEMYVLVDRLRVRDYSSIVDFRWHLVLELIFGWGYGEWILGLGRGLGCGGMWWIGIGRKGCGLGGLEDGLWRGGVSGGDCVVAGFDL